MKLLNKLLVFNSSRQRLWQQNADFAKLVPPHSLVLDAGAGDSPYRGLFSHAKYESADFEMVTSKQYGQSTYVCDLKSIPVEEGRFDFILFNQVMEHLSEPAAVLKELHRVLKPGGQLIYSAPLYYEEHDLPYDFFRYTQFGARYLFTSAGFEIKKLEWLEGYFGTMAYQFSGMARYLPSRPGLFKLGAVGWILAPLALALRVQCALLSFFLHKLEMRSKLVTAGYPKNYVAVLMKPKSI